MKTGGIGRLIGELRKEAKIAQRTLCKGLCSVQLLSKIEREERTPDMLLLESLLQRLGKSPEKLEIILSVDEYRYIDYRDEIEDAIRFGRLEEGEKKLQEYLAKYEHEGTMQLMYGYRTRGIFALERGKWETAETWIKKAVVLSAPEKIWGKLKDELLSTIELENFILLCQAWIQQGSVSKAQEVLENLHQYVSRHIVDEEEFVKIQSKITSLLGRIYNKLGQYQTCLEVCEPIFELERELFIIQAMSLLMDNLICAYSHTGKMERAERVRIWKENLESIFESQGLSIDAVNGMYFNICVRQYFLDYELIRGERIRRGLTQAQLSEGIYECVESLSRVETGKESPNRVKFQQLMEHLRVDKSRYNGYLVTNEYKAMEVDVKIQTFLSRQRLDEARRELEYLEHLIDMSEIQNIQLVQRRKNALLEKAGKMSPEQTMEEAERLLALSYDYQSEQPGRPPFRNEVYLYNQICMMLWRMGRKEESVAAYEKMVNSFEKSAVKRKYHLRSMVLLLSHMSDRMETIGRLEEAKYWAEEGLRLILLNGKSSAMEILLSNLVCVYRKQNKPRELCLKMARQTLWCSDLFKQQRYKEITLKYIRDTWGIEEKI